MDRNTLIGRGLSQIDYATYKSIQDRVTPMLTDISKVAEIIDYIKSNYDTGDSYMMNLLCVAAIYDMYCPGSFFASSIAKLQIGVRDEVAKCMGYRNAEMTNYYLDRSKAFMKFREKAFGQKVASIKEAFKHLSVRKHDWELGL